MLITNKYAYLYLKSKLVSSANKIGIKELKTLCKLLKNIFKSKGSKAEYIYIYIYNSNIF